MSRRVRACPACGCKASGECDRIGSCCVKVAVSSCPGTCTGFDAQGNEVGSFESTRSACDQAAIDAQADYPGLTVTFDEYPGCTTPPDIECKCESGSKKCECANKGGTWSPLDKCPEGCLGSCCLIAVQSQTVIQCRDGLTICECESLATPGAVRAVFHLGQNCAGTNCEGDTSGNRGDWVFIAARVAWSLHLALDRDPWRNILIDQSGSYGLEAWLLQEGDPALDAIRSQYNRTDTDGTSTATYSTSEERYPNKTPDEIAAIFCTDPNCCTHGVANQSIRRGEADFYDIFGNLVFHSSCGRYSGETGYFDDPTGADCLPFYRMEYPKNITSGTYTTRAGCP